MLQPEPMRSAAYHPMLVHVEQPFLVGTMTNDLVFALNFSMAAAMATRTSS